MLGVKESGATSGSRLNNLEIIKNSLHFSVKIFKPPNLKLWRNFTQLQKLYSKQSETIRHSSSHWSPEEKKRHQKSILISL